MLVDLIPVSQTQSITHRLRQTFSLSRHRLTTVCRSTERSSLRLPVSSLMGQVIILFVTGVTCSPAAVFLRFYLRDALHNDTVGIKVLIRELRLSFVWLGLGLLFYSIWYLIYTYDAYFCRSDVSAYYSLSVPSDCFLLCHFFQLYSIGCLMLQSLNN